MPGAFRQAHAGIVPGGFAWRQSWKAAIRSPCSGGVPMGKNVFRRVVKSALSLALVAITLIGPTGVAHALTAPIVTEEVMSIQHVGRQPDVLDLVTSRVAIPPQGQWAVDPDVGPLTFTVESGVLTVTLRGGLARLERQS